MKEECFNMFSMGWEEITVENKIESRDNLERKKYMYNTHNEICFVRKGIENQE
jgi:hypothetical protein